MANKTYSPVIQELIDMIAKNGWEDKFQKALDHVHSLNVVEYENIKTLEDYYDWCESNLHWVPKEDPEGDIVYQHVTMFYYLLDQSPVKELQTPIIPSRLKDNVMPPLSPLSAWMRKFVISLGQWMDTPESLTDDAVKSYYDSPRYNIPFHGIDNTTWGIDAYYFFNHKRYSEAASFNYSRIQKKSQGSFYTGLSIYTQKLNFDFNNIPKVLRDELPREWNNYYNINTHNYAIRVGYGYNWVFAPKWVLGVSESPVIGLRKGFVTTADSNTSFSLYNRMKLGVVWNSGRFFFGAVGKFDLAIVSDKTATYAGGMLSGEAVFGVRFNLW